MAPKFRDIRNSLHCWCVMPVVITTSVSVLGGYSQCSRNQRITVHWLLYSFRDIILTVLSQKRDIVFLLLILFAACPEISLSLRVNVCWFAFNWNRNVLKFFNKKSKKKFRENLSGGVRVFPSGQMDSQINRGFTDATKMAQRATLSTLLCSCLPCTQVCCCGAAVTMVTLRSENWKAA